MPKCLSVGLLVTAAAAAVLPIVSVAPALAIEALPTCEQGPTTCEARQAAGMSGIYVGTCQKAYEICKDTCFWNIEHDGQIYKIHIGRPCAPRK